MGRIIFKSTIANKLADNPVIPNIFLYADDYREYILANSGYKPGHLDYQIYKEITYLIDIELANKLALAIDARDLEVYRKARDEKERTRLIKDIISYCMARLNNGVYIHPVQLEPPLDFIIPDDEERP